MCYRNPDMRKLIIASFIFIIWSNTATADNFVNMKWGRTDFPPFTIISGPYEGQGVIDKMIDFYIKNLPNYKQTKISGSLRRVLTEMENGKHVCHGSLLKKKQREIFADFLEPNMIQFANGVITTVYNAEKFNPFLIDDNTIDFEKLVFSGSLKIRYNVGRSYSELIDKVIEKSETLERSSLVRKTGLKETDKEIGLILNGRMDGIIGRPEEGLYYSTLKGIKPHEIVFYKIDGDKPYKYAQVACSKGDWNRDFIEEMNALTVNSRLSEEFQSYYMEWLPSNLQKIYPSLLNEAFNHKKNK